MAQGRSVAERVAVSLSCPRVPAGRHGSCHPRAEERRGLRVPCPREAQEGPGQAARRGLCRAARVHQGHRQGMAGPGPLHRVPGAASSAAALWLALIPSALNSGFFNLK